MSYEGPLPPGHSSAEERLAPRFWSRVAAGDPRSCWLWLGAQKRDGYGHVHIGPRNGGRFTGAHRLAYELINGPIPAGLVLDHLCRVPLCVNPLHLEAVTTRENLRRGLGHGKETHCPKGHEYDAANTRIDRLNRRACRACGREHAQRRRDALKRIDDQVPGYVERKLRGEG